MLTSVLDFLILHVSLIMSSLLHLLTPPKQFIAQSGKLEVNDSKKSTTKQFSFKWAH